MRGKRAKLQFLIMTVAVAFAVFAPTALAGPSDAYGPLMPPIPQGQNVSAPAPIVASAAPIAAAPAPKLSWWGSIKSSFSQKLAQIKEKASGVTQRFTKAAPATKPPVQPQKNQPALQAKNEIPQQPQTLQPAQPARLAQQVQPGPQPQQVQRMPEQSQQPQQSVPAKPLVLAPTAVTSAPSKPLVLAPTAVTSAPSKPLVLAPTAVTSPPAKPLVLAPTATAPVSVKAPTAPAPTSPVALPARPEPALPAQASLPAAQAPARAPATEQKTQTTSLWNFFKVGTVKSVERITVAPVPLVYSPKVLVQKEADIWADYKYNGPHARPLPPFGGISPGKVAEHRTSAVKADVPRALVAKPRKLFPLVMSPFGSQKQIIVPKGRVRLLVTERIQAPFKLPKNAEKRELPLRQQIIVEPTSITQLTPDEMNLVRGILLWLAKQDDEAVSRLNRLATASKNNYVRERAFAFIGWALELQNQKTMAAMSWSRALHYVRSDVSSLRYDASILYALSRLAKDTAFAKTVLEQTELEHLTTELQSASNPEDLLQAKAFLNLLRAERAYDKGQYAAAREWAQNVPAKSLWTEHARYLAAVALFSDKGSEATLPTVGKELTELFRTVEDPALFDATAMSLGHVHFILGNYKAANQYLAQVSRDTNLFIETAVDNAWSLLRVGKRNDAVGNMFTLHTPYFDGAYMPESYFIQSLGYQEICQFGDAMTAVKQYKQHYVTAFRQLETFNAKAAKQAANVYYDDLVSYLSRKPNELPAIIARELGRNPYFLRRQKTLNELARAERQLPQVFPKSGAAIVAWAQPTFNKTREIFRTEISKQLKTRAVELEDDLKFLTANMALLEYELFAGAGSNLALQGAKNFAPGEKGDGANRKPAFDGGKEYWPYEDEIWEDELNNFRSKMIDACAKAPSQS